jgi:hypothetical protein
LLHLTTPGDLDAEAGRFGAGIDHRQFMKVILRLLQQAMHYYAGVHTTLISGDDSRKQASSNVIERIRLTVAQILLLVVVLMSSISATRPSVAKDEGRNSGAVTYSSPMQKYSYSLPGYYVSNDAWGVKDLPDGVDYSTSVSFDPANFQGGTSFSWRYPPNVGRVYGYPHIDYDPSAARVSSTQSANIAKLVASYNVYLSDTVNSTVAFDIWFGSEPNGPWETTSIELLVEVHPTTRRAAQNGILARLRRLLRARSQPEDSLVLTGGGFAGATVHISNVNESGASWKFIDVQMTEDMMSGTLSLSNVIKELIWDGVMTGQEYLGSLQFGSEVLGGTGSLRVGSLSYDWTATQTSVGATGNKAFDMTAGGGNHVVGKGVVDTAIYAGSYNSHQIKSDKVKVLVIGNDNISSLDTLEGITYIKFSDGIYNTTTGVFSGGPDVGSR